MRLISLARYTNSLRLLNSLAVLSIREWYINALQTITHDAIAANNVRTSNSNTRACGGGGGGGARLSRETTSTSLAHKNKRALILRAATVRKETQQQQAPRATSSRKNTTFLADSAQDSSSSTTHNGARFTHLFVSPCSRVIRVTRRTSRSYRAVRPLHSQKHSVARSRARIPYSYLAAEWESSDRRPSTHGNVQENKREHTLRCKETGGCTPERSCIRDTP